MSAIAILLPSVRAGGAERVNINLANAFVRRGLSVELVLMSADGELMASIDPRVQIVDLKTPRLRHTFTSFVRYLRDHQPAGVVANIWPLTLIALWARRRAKAKTRVVLVEHTSWSIDDIAKDWLWRLVIKGTMRACYRHADAVVTVSHGAARDLAAFSRLPLDAIQVVHNPIVGLGDSLVAPIPTEPAGWVEGGHKRVIAVGTLKPIKDFPTLLRALAKLRKRMDVKLLILGEGDERTSLQGLVEALNLSEHVFMPGFAFDTRPFYSSAELFVLSSTGEGLPTVMVEALEQGIPVVSTDCPSGPREILKEGKYGTLVPVGDADALATAMEASLAKTHDREALKARAQDFSVDKAADAYLDLLLPGWRERAAS